MRITERKKSGLADRKTISCANKVQEPDRNVKGRVLLLLLLLGDRMLRKPPRLLVPRRLLISALSRSNQTAIDASRIVAHNRIEKPLALPGDSQSLTVPGVVVGLGLEFASFPLTPTLSPRRGRTLERCWKTLTLRLHSASVSFVSEAQDNQARSYHQSRGECFSLSLGERAG